MQVIDGIAYAGEAEPLLKVVGIRAMDGYALWLRFSNNTERLFDFKPMLEFPLFKKLQDQELFRGVYLDNGVPTWLDGEIDLAPEMLFDKSRALAVT
jgi:hypothetical protein